MGHNYYAERTFDASGNMISMTTKTKYKANAEQFARVFFQDIGVLASCSGAEKGIVLSCLQYLDYNTNQFILTPERRDEICKNADLSAKTISGTLSNLRRKNIIIKQRGYSFILNPNILFYGDERERKTVIDATAEYKLGGGMQKPNPLAKKRP